MWSILMFSQKSALPFKLQQFSLSLGRCLSQVVWEGLLEEGNFIWALKVFRIPVEVKEMKVGEDEKGELGKRKGEGGEMKDSGVNTRKI